MVQVAAQLNRFFGQIGRRPPFVRRKARKLIGSNSDQVNKLESRHKLIDHQQPKQTHANMQDRVAF